MPEELLSFLEDELAFFDRVTDISGSLYSVPKDERKAGAVKLARQVGYSSFDCYKRAGILSPVPLLQEPSLPANLTIIPEMLSVELNLGSASTSVMCA